MNRLSQYMIANRGRVTRGMSYVPRIECPDGFSVSVQAHEGAYCTPRDAVGPWTHVECGFPSNRDDAIMPYIDDARCDPRETVYAYVPVDVVEAMLIKHGWEASE